MKKIILLFTLSLFSTLLFSQPSLDYYFSEEKKEFNPAIPTPQSVLGFEVGEWHVSHDKLSEYMKALAQASDRVQIVNRGTTYEGRPLWLLTISSPENLANIEAIQKKHLELSEPQGANLDTNDMPIVVYQGFSIHGNEPSGSNASMLEAYYLAASNSAEINEMLENMVILLDPSFNPDGLQSFSQWANSHKSNLLNPDNYDREYDEAWPRGRTNHYWFDMNRDWLPVQLNESKARIKTFTQWLPNILTDHHEMGTNSTFFFQPGISSRVNPLTPKKNQKLTKQISNFHADALNKIGSLYYTEEDFDDYYYGKGSTYPDVNGSIGILFEQASSRGHIQNSDNGVLTFPFTIKNQLTTSFSTLKAAKNMRVELLNYQREFYQNALKLGKEDKNKGYLFGTEKDPIKPHRLVEILKRHEIKVHHLNKDIVKNGKKYNKENSFIIPFNQKKYKLIKAIFQTQTKFEDSLFYDVSAWTLPYAFNLNYEDAISLNYMGEELEKAVPPSPPAVTKSTYAYLLEGYNYLEPKVLNKLLNHDIRVKVSLKPFSINSKNYGYGSLMIPVANQALNAEELHNVISKLSKENAIKINSVETGLTEGIDLGSRNFRTVSKPTVGLFVGNGVRSYDAGEIWHLMDLTYEMPITKLDVSSIGNKDLSKYTHLILPSFSGNGNNQLKTKIDTWVQNGGILIAYRDAIKWIQKKELVEFEIKAPIELDASKVSFDNQQRFYGAQRIGGAIFNTKLDKSHPITFGIETTTLPMFRNSSIFLNPEKEKYNNPIQYTQSPLLSGYISEEKLNELKSTVPVKIVNKGKGKIILITDNTNFRAFWLGTNKILANTLFYGELM